VLLSAAAVVHAQGTSELRVTYVFFGTVHTAKVPLTSVAECEGKGWAKQTGQGLCLGDGW